MSTQKHHIIDLSQDPLPILPVFDPKPTWEGEMYNPPRDIRRDPEGINRRASDSLLETYISLYFRLYLNQKVPANEGMILSPIMVKSKHFEDAGDRWGMDMSQMNMGMLPISPDLFCLFSGREDLMSEDILHDLKGMFDGNIPAGMAAITPESIEVYVLTGDLFRITYTLNKNIISLQTLIRANQYSRPPQDILDLFQWKNVLIYANMICTSFLTSEVEASQEGDEPEPGESSILIH